MDYRKMRQLTQLLVIVKQIKVHTEKEYAYIQNECKCV